MKRLFTEEELFAAKSRELLPLECLQCEGTFTKEKSQIKAVIKSEGKSRTAAKFCSRECAAKYHTKSQKVSCEHCGKDFFKKLKEIRKSPHHFCTRSCAAKVNNINAPKRVKEGVCKRCGEAISSRRSYCKPCIKDAQDGKWKLAGTSIAKFSLGALIDVNPGARASDAYRKVRDQAKQIVSNLVGNGKVVRKCCVCSYDKVTHICHIKDISQFSLNDRLSEINSLSNLSIMCPNHHHEFDHNKGVTRQEILSIEEELS